MSLWIIILDLMLLDGILKGSITKCTHIYRPTTRDVYQNCVNRFALNFVFSHITRVDALKIGYLIIKYKLLILLYLKYLSIV